MKIDELIENAEEKSRVHEYHADIFENGNPMRDACIKSSQDCKQLAEWFKQLKEYQQLEADGRLIKLPCRVGTEIYFVPSKTNFNLNVLHSDDFENKVYKQKIAKITFNQSGWYFECDANLEYGIENIFTERSYKETWFLSREEAEAKLEELRGDNND